MATINKKTIQVGDIVQLGAYEQDNNPFNGAEDIEWKVLAIGNGEALLISVYVLDCQPFNKSEVDRIYWSNSDLKAWLENEFSEKAFASEEKAIITEGPLCLGSDAVQNIYFSSDDERKCSATAYATAQGAKTEDGGTSWWLRGTDNSGLFGSQYANLVYPDGATHYTVNGNNFSYHGNVETPHGVRPAVWVSLQ